MSSPGTAGDKFWTQYDPVVAAAGQDDVELAYYPEDARERSLIPDFVYEKDRLLVRKSDLTTVRRSLPQAEVAQQSGDVILLDTGGTPAPAAVDRAEKDSGHRGIATPHHLMSICPANLCSADEPSPVPYDTEVVPPIAPYTTGVGVRVSVIDTGLVPTYVVTPWLAGTEGPVYQRPHVQPVGTDAPPRRTYDLRGNLMEYAGHGTFVASLLRRLAPGTKLYVSGALVWAGAALEQQICAALMTELDKSPDIISMSAGGATYNDQPYLGLEPVRARLAQPDCTTLLVAAAGNDGGTAPFWPAAYAPQLPDAVISVGALRQDGAGRACFSNYGDWVRVYAPGERLVNSFAFGPYSYVDPPRLDCRYHRPALYGSCTCVTAPPQYAIVNFVGKARWSGTSFATPVVAGMVAAHMTASGQPNARLAAADLLTKASEITDTDGVTLPVLTF